MFATPVNEKDLPRWERLPAVVRSALTAANLTETVFGELGRRRGDALNFLVALSDHGLWDVIWIRDPLREMGYNGLRFAPRTSTADLVDRLSRSPRFTDLATTIRGRINSRFHPERFNFSENIPWTASLHFTFNETGPADVHFDLYNAHAAAPWPILGHALFEYPMKFFREVSSAEDIRRCLSRRFNRDVWREFPEWTQW